MSKDHYTMSQQFEVVCPQRASAMPVLFTEWKDIKDSILNLGFKHNWYYTVASILIGFCGSSLIRALTGEFPAKQVGQMPMEQIICWFLVVTSFIMAIALFFCGKHWSNMNSTSAQQIVKFMELIEDRYKKPI